MRTSESRSVQIFVRLFILVMTGTVCSPMLAGPADDNSQGGASHVGKAIFRSPESIVVTSDGKRAYVTDRTAGCVVVLDVAGGKKIGEVALGGDPRGLCLSPDDHTLYVARRLGGSVAIIDTATRKVLAQVSVPRRPIAVALAPKGHRLFVTTEDTNRIWVYDCSAQPLKLVQEIPAVREPSSVSITADERWVVVTNLLPDGVSTDPTLSAVVTVIDGKTLKPAGTIKLPPGSTGVYDGCVSPDGRWAYVVHSVGRFTLPITQLERGWVNTTALSVLDLTKKQRLATVLLDMLTMGAADPHDVICSSDGGTLWISHSGTHEVSEIDVARLHALLDGKVPAELASLKDGSLPNIWVRIQKDRKLIAELENDLTALYIAGVIRRTKSGGMGPRGLAVSPDSHQVLIANYFSGSVAILQTDQFRIRGTLPLGVQPSSTSERRGEMVFHDATKAFQRWYSCATCHPNEGRVDALSWDFLRDGIGNPKDTINLVYLDRTPPLNRRATRKTARECARTGLTDGHMLVPTSQDVDDVLAYLVALRPEPSPYLTADGKLSKEAVRGKAIFEGKAECAQCHRGPYHTDLKMHDVGTRTQTDSDGRYDTPGLIELYRTAPYLHDGRAHTLRDVLTTDNPDDLHGKTSELSASELNDLTAFLRSL